MRAYLPDFAVVNLAELHEALDALASGENIIPLAGGTDLMVYLEAGDLPPCAFLNLQEIRDFQRAPQINASLVLYPLTTYRDTRVTAAIRQKFPMLARAAREVGALAIQSRGTWAGNIANASPAADGVPALMAYDAEVELSSKSGRRSVPLSRFYTGYKKTERRPDELITAIRLPLPQPGAFEYYRKVGTRRFQAISKTLLAGRILLGWGSKGEGRAHRACQRRALHAARAQDGSRLARTRINSRHHRRGRASDSGRDQTDRRHPFD